MFKTRITEMFGIEYPIISGPMGNLSHAELVSAVSNAGGLGILVSTTHPTPKELREEIKKTKRMTDKPFAVNITLLPAARPIDYEDYFNTAIEEGVGVPKDLSVIGFDDNPLALNFSPIPITTMRQPLHKMAMIATETLYKVLIKKIKTSSRIILPSELVVRNSCQSLT